MAAKKGELAPRPPRKTEYEIRFATTHARKGWRDLVATIRNPMAHAWDFLTRTPLDTTSTNYRLKGELATIRRGEARYDRWQHKPTAKGTARIWFYVDGHTVFLEQVHTNHPNETK
ncbi:hypothetical protein B841_00160 [Corynebacterium maris DSM 45190]|uniref:Uncharacterized protein n=1 Tax=Corynebacterium maris DSM 45190 TaxID=1224163 RepID=S5SZ42_9CORY|nr:hypothetical protein [Corynebacterium maris]AGS33515.1 hypothetical protein B841_00160 [Corynebacterium maris DSM 45190]